MTVTSKAALLKNLSVTELLSSPHTGPFVGLNLSEAGVVHLRRTSDQGYIETELAPHQDDPGWMYVSLAHLKENLRAIDSETVDLLRMTSGVLMLRSVNSLFDTELRVYTVAKAHSGFKQHNPGMPKVRGDVSWLGGLNVRPFALTMPPVVDGARVILATTGGILVWNTETDPCLPSSPRDIFLRAMAGVDSGPFTLTDRNFFAIGIDGMTICIAGHGVAFPQVAPSTVGALRLTEIPAERLGKALRTATSLASPGATVTMAPRYGVVTRNGYNQPVRFGLGELDPFLPFDIGQLSAKLIADVQEQVKEGTVTLYRAASSHDRLLFSMGNCLVQVQGAASSLPS